MARKATKKAVEAEVKTVETPVEEVKAAEAEVVEVKEEAKVEEVKVEEVKEEEAPVEEVKKAPAKKAAAKKTTTRKTKEAKVEKTTLITLEFGEYTATMNAVEEKVTAQFVAEGNNAADIKTCNIYLKPFENAAYYVINDTVTGRVDLF